jgi:hypothetical protein
MHWTVFLPIAAILVGLLAWGIASDRRRHRAQLASLDQLGFHACPEEKDRLQETVTRLESNRGYAYTLREVRRLARDPRVYYYVKVRSRGDDELPLVEEEILFPLNRPSRAGLTLIVKPTSLPAGPAARFLGAFATAARDTQPDDLQRLELPPDLRQTNLMGALAAPGTTLYELIDPGTLSVVQGLGDAGGMFVRFRDDLCTVSSTSRQVPFKVQDLMARLQPLLEETPALRGKRALG